MFFVHLWSYTTALVFLFFLSCTWHVPSRILKLTLYSRWSQICSSAIWFCHIRLLALPNLINRLWYSSACLHHGYSCVSQWPFTSSTPQKVTHSHTCAHTSTAAETCNRLWRKRRGENTKGKKKRNKTSKPHVVSLSQSTCVHTITWR